MSNPVFRNGHKILIGYEKMNPFNCPVDERTADGVYVGACEYYLQDGTTCPRHGIVKESANPTPPLNRLIREGEENSKHLCPKCGSSFKRKWGFRTKHCIQPKCENYHLKNK